MRIGVDFGTTRVVVAAVDRGNFPLVYFETPDGQMRDWYPPIVAVNGDQRVYGWNAVAVQDEKAWTILRSPKRLLRTAGPRTVIRIDDRAIPLHLLMTEMMADLRTQLLEHSNLSAEPDERLEAMLGVPANANSNQRTVHLNEQFNHNFGIWREAESGGAIVFDLIFARGMRLPDAGQPPLQVERVYRPAHNIGHLRYLECSKLNELGQPVGEITNWEQIQFPFDPTLWNRTDLLRMPVDLMSSANSLTAREEYSCDANGDIRVKISIEPSNKMREYNIGKLAFGRSSAN
jgi:hypothetical protein